MDTVKFFPKSQQTGYLGGIFFKVKASARSNRLVSVDLSESPVAKTLYAALKIYPQMSQIW